MMRILCSNDDGIHSGGLTALEEVARELTDDVWTVAPEVDQSGMSRSITLTRPLRVRKVAHQRFAVDGTPTDCVQLGVTHLLDKKPDLILSGINNGHNIADDVTFSGTVAVALQGIGPTQDNKGTLMKLEDSDLLYITHLPGMNGYLSERYSAVPSDWKSHELFAIPVNNIKSVTIEFPETPEQNYKITNNQDRTFKLQRYPSGENVPVYDTLKVLQLIAAFGDINYESALDNMNNKRIDSLKASTPFRSLTIETVDGQTHTLNMYHRKNYDHLLDLDGNPFPYDVDRMYAFKNDSREALSVQFFVMDEVGRKLSTLAPGLFPSAEE